MFVCLETLLRAPACRLCEKLGIDPHARSLRAARRAAVFILFVLCCVLFRAQSIAEVGIAFRQIFTAWGAGAEYVAQAFESLGMTSLQFIFLVLALSAMALVYHLPQGEARPALLQPQAAAVRSAGATSALFIYGVLAVAFCWLALLANSDVSGFAYFQF